MSSDKNAIFNSQKVKESWPVMVLAHNEEQHIVACLDSIFSGNQDCLLEVYVIANGCTDSTEQLVRQYQANNAQVHLVLIEMPDKCNAWNVFVHETIPTKAPDRSAYFFMDGDAQVVHGSFAAMVAGLRENKHAHAASAPPASGRSLARDRKTLLEERHLVANLYALRGSFVEALQAKKVRLPLGLEGDDGLIGALVKWDLDPARDHFDDFRIEPCKEAGFTFQSMSFLKAADWLSYWHRSVRYGRRRYEFTLLGKRLRDKGIDGLPEHINELYAGASNLQLMWDGFYTIPNWVALRQMRRYTG